MLSYRKIIEKFEEFATNHFVIKSYGTGEAFQIVEHNKLKNRKYPMMWVEDLPFPFSTKSVTYSFRVYFLAQVATLKNASPTTLEQTNVVEVKSDMLQVAQDLVSFWVQDHNFDEIDLEKNTLATPFHDTLEDSLTGFYIDIKLEQAFTYNSCIIPMSGATPPPTEGVIITINGDSFTTTACGSSEDIIVKDTLGAAVGSKIGSEWIVPVTGGENVSNLYKTGVTDSVRTGDDGDLEEGRGVDWFNLGYNNPWGHGFRFVGSTGGYTDRTGWFDKNGVATTYAAAFPNDECSDWAYYNHGYTSNILNTPEDDAIAYERSSPIYFAEGLNKPLLINAPMVDDNVFFEDTVRLVQRLIELEKQDFETAIYPVEPHGFVQPSSWLNEYRRILKLFETTL